MGKKKSSCYPSYMSDEEWSLWLRIWPLAAKTLYKREHSWRAVFNGLRYIVETDNQWRMMPHDLPPWPAVY